jgi:D-arginine dehydrogenase
MVETCDFLVIGGGMAGASAAHELSRVGKVVIVERESQPGYHTTGRSAALFVEAYGNAVIRAINKASRSFLENPPEGFCEVPILTPRGTMFVATEATLPHLRAEFEEVRHLTTSVRLIDATEVHELHPELDRDLIVAGLHSPDDMDIDVSALHWGYLRGARSRGAILVGDAELTSLGYHAGNPGGTWLAKTRAGEYAAPIVINAAGAWADEVGAMAGAKPIGLVPKRRTAFTFDPPADKDMRRLPGVIAADESWFLKPEAGHLLGSPAEETPSVPCDAQPEELDIAIAVDRIETHTTLKVGRLVSKRAGLRSFVADKSPVVGLEPGLEGFCWCAGQGGYGIQTAPGMGRVTAALATGTAFPDDLATLGLSPVDLAPDRSALLGARLFRPDTG